NSLSRIITFSTPRRSRCALASAHNCFTVFSASSVCITSTGYSQERQALSRRRRTCTGEILLCSHGGLSHGQIDTKRMVRDIKKPCLSQCGGILYIRFGNCVRQKLFPASAKLQPVVHRAETRSIT